MAAYHRVYDSRHLQADCQEPDQLRNPTIGNEVWATFTFFYLCLLMTKQLSYCQHANTKSLTFLQITSQMLVLMPKQHSKSIEGITRNC